MRSRSTVIGAVTVLILLVCLACGDQSTPVAPTPPIVNDTFTGTLAPGGRDTHRFTVQTAGALDVTVISLSPDPAITIGVGLGTPSDDDCRLRLQNTAAHQSSLIAANATVAGPYCFVVFDTGGIAEGSTTDYVITLTHF